MNPQANFVSGMIVGAGLMYMLDPERGRRRRALLRDQIVHGAHEVEGAGEWMAGKAQHLRNRAQGVVAETRGRLRRDDAAEGVEEAGAGAPN